MSIVKILFADDDEEDQLILRDAFREIGFPDTLQFVNNGEQVIEYLQSLAHSEQMPCLIVLDLNMPKMNGTETLHVLKNTVEYENIPVIIFSTSINERERKDTAR